MKYFDSCKCVEDVKKLYKELLMKWHPDRCTDEHATEITQEINNEYERVFNLLRNVHRNMEGETYESKTENPETAKQYSDIINKIIHYMGVHIELVGAWLWVSGDTKPYKDELKKMGFRWSQNKMAWAYHNAPYHKRGKKKYTMDEIRNMWGTEKVDNDPYEGLAN